MKPSPDTDVIRRPWFVPKSFRWKFILVVGGAVLFDLLISGSVALWNVQRLGEDASQKIRDGLEVANREYLENYIQTTALRANQMVYRVFSEVETLAAHMQQLIDTPQAPNEQAAAVPDFAGRFVYNQKGGWVENKPGEDSVISVWGYLLGPDHQPRPDVMEVVRNTEFFDRVGPNMMAHGVKKLQMYYMGPKDRPIMRTTPYSYQAETFDKLYPGHDDENFWDFFFPGAYEGWQKWLKEKSIAPDKSQITVTEPYIDAITGNLIVTFFHPLWNKERTDCAGAVAADITLDQMVALIEGIHLAQTGFGFLAMSNGNVFAIPSHGQEVLGLKIVNSGNSQGVTGLDRNLRKSTEPAVASLAMPKGGGTEIKRITILENGRQEPYIIVLQRLQERNLWADKKISPDHLFLGFAVPEREIYTSLYATQKAMAKATFRIKFYQAGVFLLSLTVVMFAVVGISKRITSGLLAMSGVARSIRNKDYSVRIKIKSDDEIGEYGRMFNTMAQEIQEYTTDLESLVAKRTGELEKATDEIRALNTKLQCENLRMGAELDVARQMQLMVLPRSVEFASILHLDIASHAEPATEVGGDYYDVLQSGPLVKIGIGDVTGHGLASGVMMLMVQSVARTLLENNQTDPILFLSVLNRVICKNVERMHSDNNLTLAFLDYSENSITITGQHEEVILIRANGELEQIDTMDLGFPVGLELDIAPFLASHKVPFHTGDIIVVYTDGVTEAANTEGVLYGMKQLCSAARRNHTHSATEIKDSILADVKAHMGSQIMFDDITLVVIKHL